MAEEKEVKPAAAPAPSSDTEKTVEALADRLAKSVAEALKPLQDRVEGMSKEQEALSRKVRDLSAPIPSAGLPEAPKPMSSADAWKEVADFLVKSGIH